MRGGIGIGIGRGHQRGRPPASGPAVLWAWDPDSDALAAWAGNTADYAIVADATLGGTQALDLAPGSPSGPLTQAVALPASGVYALRVPATILGFGYADLLTIIGPSGATIVNIGPQNGDATYTLVVRGRTGAGFWTADTSAPVPQGAPTILQLVYDYSGAQPVITFYADDAALASVTDTSAGATQAARTVSGFGLQGDSDLRWHAGRITLADGYQGTP